MLQSLGHRIVCDGKYVNDSGTLVPCGVELHPGTIAQISKDGVLGHHCEFCHDPQKTVALAKRLDVSSQELREMTAKDRSAALAAADKREADQLAAQKRKQELDAAISGLKPDADGKWPVGKELFESKKEAVEFLTGKAKNGGWPPK